MGHANTFSPVCDTESETVMRKHTIIRAIPCLLVASNPTAVVRFIVSVVVDTIYLIFRRRSRPHVRKEVYERLPPAITNINSTPAVVSVLGVVRVIAPVEQVIPTGVFRRPVFISTATAMFDVSAPRRAGLGVSIAQRVCHVDRSGSALTTASPEGSPPLVFASIGQNRQSAIFLASQVLKVVGVWGNLFRSHVNLLDRFAVVRAVCGLQPTRGLHYGTSLVLCQGGV